MIDIHFYQKFANTKGVLMADEKAPRLWMANELERLRSDKPVVYNIETTNACNMRCQMCPRTTMMTRPVETMKPDLFRRIIDQLTPWTVAEWQAWEMFFDHKPIDNCFTQRIFKHDV
jgi:uncharacterized radical SAM superfamily Fe-S cluster-containing enzyme